MNVLEYLEKHLDSNKALSVLNYLNEFKCALKITKPRKTKRGDFRQIGRDLSISVNHDNNSYRFLFTLVHEIAHLKTYVEFRNKVKPHGVEWKRNFRELFYSFRMNEEFGGDPSVLIAVDRELRNPKACSGISLELEKAFSKFDEFSGKHLGDLLINELFIFRGHKYKKLETRRTRVVCLNLGNNRKYSINKAALVDTF